MELKIYLQVFKKYLAFIAIVSAIGALLAVSLAKNLPSGFVFSQTLLIVPSSSSDSADSNRSYYAQEKARNFTDTAVVILDSSDFKLQVMESGQSLNVRKLAPQVIRLTATTADPQTSKAKVKEATDLFNSRFAALSGQNQTLNLQEIGPAPEPALTKINKSITTLAGLVLGFTFAILVIGLKTYFKV